MTRDPTLLTESAALKTILDRFPTIAALRADAGWPALELRLNRMLATVRRYAPPTPPPPPTRADAVRAVHWNIEHGNWYAQIEAALLGHDRLRAADLFLFNEIDLGMARAGNRDVTGDLAAALGLYGVWAPLFLETTLGRDDDLTTAAGRANQEALFGVAILSRWPIGAVRVVPLPSPMAVQFDLERMYGRHVALVAEIERPSRPFVAVSAHLEVHRARRHRADQVRTLVEALAGELRPVIVAGDFNTHTFDRGTAFAPLTGAAALLLMPSGALRRRLLHPDRGPDREPLFDVLADAGFEWEAFVDRIPTLQLRLDRIEESQKLLGPFARLAHRALSWAERRGTLRLDWFAGRGWRGGHGFTVPGLDGPGRASDHAPIVAEFEDAG